MRVEDALRYLRESAVHDRVSQAYLVTGNPAEEGAAVAEGLLAMLFCSAGADGVCGTCAGCRRVRERTHPDVLWVEPQLKSRA
ncbi:MAG: hypothetical protein JW951_04325, partial [Lentisphaerae bacterium]|nr:hypothetical protein [Lentisphaerota bacterium]